MKSKGLTEEGLAAIGYDETIIFRPSMLAVPGGRAESRILEFMLALVLSPVKAGSCSWVADLTLLQKQESHWCSCPFLCFCRNSNPSARQRFGCLSFSVSSSISQFLTGTRGIQISESCCRRNRRIGESRYWEEGGTERQGRLGSGQSRRDQIWSGLSQLEPTNLGRQLLHSLLT